MLAVQGFIDLIPPLIGADTGGLAEATPFVAVRLAKTAFTEDVALVIGDMDEADFDGYAELHAASAATQVFLDPVTGLWTLQVREPAGGWHWVTSGVTNLPQTIYGFYLTDAAGTLLLGVHRFASEDEVLLQIVGQGVDVPNARFALNAQPLT